MAKFLDTSDVVYNSLFGKDSGWLQLCERLVTLDINDTKNDAIEIVSRFQKYIYSNGPVVQVPIGEAMVNYKEGESCQIFVPFISVSSFLNFVIYKRLQYNIIEGCQINMYGGKHFFNGTG